MSASRERVWLRRGIGAALAASGLLFSWAWERGSLERANRLHRSGDVAEAAVLFDERTGAEAEPELRYNLGTSLLELGSPFAPDELEAAAEAGAEDVRARSLYNRGLFSLRSALDGTEGDSLRTLAEEAVDANRQALVLRPDHEDTKWNLAMAQRLLDSIDAADRRAGRETAQTALEADEVVQSENVLEVDEEQELPEDAPRQGEEETRADSDEEDPMSRLEAAEILSSTHLDPTLMIRKLLALESRSFWGRRARRAVTPRR